MSREMMKAGVIEEMMEDTFEAIDDPEELDEDVQQAVDKILSGNSIHKFSSGVLWQLTMAFFLPFSWNSWAIKYPSGKKYYFFKVNVGGSLFKF